MILLVRLQQQAPFKTTTKVRAKATTTTNYAQEGDADAGKAHDDNADDGEDSCSNH